MIQLPRCVHLKPVMSAFDVFRQDRYVDPYFGTGSETGLNQFCFVHFRPPLNRFESDAIKSLPFDFYTAGNTFCLSFRSFLSLSFSYANMDTFLDGNELSIQRQSRLISFSQFILRVTESWIVLE